LNLNPGVGDRNILDGGGGEGDPLAAAREAHKRSMALSFSVFPPVLERDWAATMQGLMDAMLAGSTQVSASTIASTPSFRALTLACVSDCFAVVPWVEIIQPMGQ
jgi:hypothetical protein